MDADQLVVLRGYGTERDMAAGEVLFADGYETYDLIVILDGTAEIIQGYGRPDAALIARYGRFQFLGEIGMLTGQRAYLTAVATSAGRLLAVPVAQLRVVLAHEPGLSGLILSTFPLRHSILMRRGAGLTLVGSRFDPDTRRLVELLARNRLVSTWLDLEALPEAEAVVQGLELPVSDLPIIIIPGGPLMRNPSGRALLDALGMSGTESPSSAAACDLLVVGGGPAGLAAAVYGASEGPGPCLCRRQRNPRIIVWPQTQVTALRSSGQLEGLRIRRAGQPGESDLAVGGLFVFVGAKPRTGWLAGQLAEDSDGFLLTGTDIPAAGLGGETTTPLFLETSRPGIFAVAEQPGN